MKKASTLLIIFSLCLLAGTAQPNNSAYAITGQANGSMNWTDLRSINFNTGDAGQTLFENEQTNFTFKEAVSGKPVTSFILPNSASDLPLAGKITGNVQVLNVTPTTLMCAALAYDKRHNKLFFSSMHTGQLMWLDLNGGSSTPSFYLAETRLVDNNGQRNEALNITRMTIGADGYGYALSNDGNHLIKFSTGKKTTVSDLGSLLDDNAASGVSIHNPCGSWGGDMVADASGKLILFTAFQHVYEIETTSRITTYLGRIKNLPASYLVNGAAVTEDGFIMISSGNTAEGFYKLDPESFTATKLQTKGVVYNASDLASSHLLGKPVMKSGAAVLAPMETMGNEFISIYPNPVSDGRITVTFDNNPAGEYKIALTDLQGRMIESKSVYIRNSRQSEKFRLKMVPAKGLYLISITDAGLRKIFSGKIVVE